jgi:hypothetical protein
MDYLAMQGRTLSEVQGTMDALSAISMLTGKTISIHRSPVTGQYVILDGKLVQSEICVRSTDDVEIHTEQICDGDRCGQISSVYVGTRWHGIIAHWIDGAEGGWANCYSNGNFGKDYASWGTWGGPSRERYATIRECLEHRNYRVGDRGDIRRTNNEMMDNLPAITDAILETGLL